MKSFFSFITCGIADHEHKTFTEALENGISKDKDKGMEGEVLADTSAKETKEKPKMITTLQLVCNKTNQDIVMQHKYQRKIQYNYENNTILDE